MDLFSLSAYQYELPEELIAQYPCQPRDASRLLIVNRRDNTLTEKPFRYLIELLHSGDELIFNDTKVIAARLLGKRGMGSGGAAEVFLTKRHSDGTWDAMVKPGRKLPVGARVDFNSELYGIVIVVYENGERRIRFHSSGNIDEAIEKAGKIPLPQYIKRQAEEQDSTLYQTVYASKSGALAAPTAGLHFTHEMLHELKEKGVHQTHITLHTGLGTFKPVKMENIRDHEMHSERYIITEDVADRLNASKKEGHRQICVGTTSCRTLESAANSRGLIEAGEHETKIFIYPGYRFKYVSSLLTNFHLPGSTLLMLVSAFAGYELIKEAYAKAIRDRFRFYSYGDAMLIL